MARGVFILFLLFSFSEIAKAEEKIFIFTGPDSVETVAVESAQGTFKDWFENSSEQVLSKLNYASEKEEVFRLKAVRVGLDISAAIGVGSLFQLGVSPGFQLHFTRQEEK